MSGKHWHEVTPRAARAADDQWFPWVAADQAGHVSVVFYDRSYDPANHLSDTTLVQSSNAGNSWTVKRVSDFSSNFDNSFFGCGCFIGDYNGNAIDQHGVSQPQPGIPPRGYAWHRVRRHLPQALDMS